MGRSTNNCPSRPQRTRRYQLNLDHRVDDKSGAANRKRAVETAYDWEAYYGKRPMRLRRGFPDDWDTTDDETPEGAIDQYNRWLDDEGIALLDEYDEYVEAKYRPCTCIGPCIYPKGALHPTREEQLAFADAIKQSEGLSTWEQDLLRGDVQKAKTQRSPMTRRERDIAAFNARRARRTMNTGTGLKQFRPEPDRSTGYVRTSRARIVTGRSV